MRLKRRPDCSPNRQTRRSARPCCVACYQFRKNLWITGLAPGRFEIVKPADFRKPARLPASSPHRAPSRHAFRYKILMNKQAESPQRPWMLRSALLIQEKSVDNSPCAPLTTARFPCGWPLRSRQRFPAWRSSRAPRAPRAGASGAGRACRSASPAGSRARLCTRR